MSRQAGEQHPRMRTRKGPRMGCGASPLQARPPAGSAATARGIQGTGRMEVGEDEGGVPLISLLSDIPNFLALESKVQTSTRAREQMVLSPP